jgi:tRNA-splicing ligase RtcB
LAQALFRTIPVGVGSTGKIALDEAGMTAMLARGARWALEQGYGRVSDLERIEEGGCAADADPAAVSDDARRRQRKEMGTLGSGNHYLEVQEVAEEFDPAVADAFGLKLGECVVTIHCGSRGLGHQIGTEFPARDGRSRASAMASRCPTGSWPARPSSRSWAGATWAPCARP